MSKIDIMGSYWTLAVGANPATQLASEKHCPHDFKERVEAAANAGYTGMGFWHDDLFKLREGIGFSEMKTILDANGIVDVEIEWLLGWFYEDERRAESDHTRSMLLDAAEALDALYIKVADTRNDCVDLPEMSEHFALLCRQAAERGTAIHFELLPDWLSRIPSLDEVLTLTRDCGETNCGLALDILHLEVIGITSEELKTKLRPSDKINIELNDGLTKNQENLYEATVNQRLLPGDGEFDITGYLEAIRDVGYRGPIGVEVLNAEMRTWSLNKAADISFNKTHDAALKVNWN